MNSGMASTWVTSSARTSIRSETLAEAAACTSRSRFPTSRMLAMTRNPAWASSTEVSRPKPLDAPVNTATFSGIAKVYHNRRDWNRARRSGTIKAGHPLQRDRAPRRSHAGDTASFLSQSLLPVPSSAHRVFTHGSADSLRNADLVPCRPRALSATAPGRKHRQDFSVLAN